MLTIKKKTVIRISQVRLTIKSISVLNPRIGSTLDTRVPLQIFTTCVRGKTTIAVSCTLEGSEVSGKKVPLKKSIGVMNRNDG
jgi:hypothetical protein